MSPRQGIRAGGFFDGEQFRQGPVLVLIEDGVITSVDVTTTQCPDDVSLIDLDKAFLLPGLVDAHTHMCWDPHGDPHDIADTDRDVLLERAHRHSQQAMKSGVTTIRDLGDRDYVMVSLREQYRQEHGAGPELVVSGPPITRSGGHCCFLGGEADSVADLIAAVEERARQGVDWVKIMATGGFTTHGSNPWEAQYTAAELTALVDTAHESGLPVTAHVHATAGIAAAVAAGVDGMEHCTFITETGNVVDPYLAEAIATQGIWCGMTIARPRPDMPTKTLTVLQSKWDNVRQLMAAGVRVVFSTDAGINSSKLHDVLPDDLIYLGTQGFSVTEVLKGATAHAAASCGLAHRKGRIAQGYDADLLVVSDDVLRTLDVLSRPLGIWRAGVSLADTAVAPPA